MEWPLDTDNVTTISFDGMLPREREAAWFLDSVFPMDGQPPHLLASWLTMFMITKAMVILYI